MQCEDAIKSNIEQL